MGFADRNSLAGRTSSVTFPDAIKRNGSSNTATRLEVQLTDSNGSPNDPDSSLVYVRVTNEAGTASDSLLYTDAAMSSAATNSTNATYNNGSSAFWKMVTTSGGKITLYHKTGTASSVEGSFVLEIAWFENSSAVATSHPFRIVDAADLDTMAANIDSVLEDTGTTLPSTLSSISSAVGALNDASSAGNADAVWDEAMSGHTSSGTAGKALADVLADTAALDGAWADGGRLDVILDAALADTNELQGDWTDGGRLDAILDSVLADTATLGAPAGASHAADVAAVKTVVDTILVDTSTTLDDFIDTEVAAILADTATLGSPAGASHAADNAAIKAETASILADTATLGAPAGASHAADNAAIKTVVDSILTDTGTTLNNLIDTEVAAILEDTGTTLPAAIAGLNDPSAANNADATWDETMSGHVASGTAGKMLADVLADTAALDGAWADGGRLDAILDSVLADTATLGSPAGADHAADVAAIKTVVDTILVDTSTTLDDFIDTEVAAILADTATLGAPAGASHAADNAAIKAVVDGVATAVSAVQNNTRFVATVPPKLNRESAAVAIKCFLYDTAGNMEDADSNEVFVKISQMDGSAVANRYYSNSGLSSAISAEGSGTFSGYYQVPRSAAGLYSFFYKNDAAHTEENLIVEFGWVEGSSTIYQSRAMQISDAADLDDIVADTNELQGDWTNGGRLDLILDAVLADTATLGAAAGASHAADNAAIKTVVDSILTDTATLGSPAGADHATDIAAIKTVVDTILVDTSTTLDDFIDTEVAAILADTATLGSPAGASHAADNAAIKAETAAILEDTGTTLPAAIAALNDPSAANNADAIWDETMSGHVASGTAGKMLADILADTAALDGAWADGGRLDLILDAVLADTATLGAPAGASHAADNAAIKTVVDSILTDTGTTLNNLIDTEVAAILADTATLGAPAGASHAADIAAIKADTAAILTDTSTTLDDLIDTEVAAILADTNELQGDWADGGRLDLLLDKAAQSVHHATMKRYLKNDTTVMSSDPSDDAVACSSTTQSTTYVVLDVLPVILDEGSDATFTDVFAVLKWLHQGTNNGGGGAVTTKWMISGAAETAGSAPSGSAVTITGETTGNTTANTSSMSGLLTTTALAALASAANGQLRFLLCGKVADARDTCTGRVYKSTSAEISYQV